MLQLIQNLGRLHVTSYEPPGTVGIFTADGARPIVKSIDPGKNSFDFPGGRLVDVKIVDKARAMRDIAPIYVCRNLLNGKQIIEHFKSQGFGDMLVPRNLHCTIVYSKAPVDWHLFANSLCKAIVYEMDNQNRSVEFLGPKSAVVLKFKSHELESRHYTLRSLGASSDFPDFLPHITLTYNANGHIQNPADFAPFIGPLIFGPEVMSDLGGEEYIEKSMNSAPLKFSWDRIRGLVTLNSADLKLSSLAGFEEC